MNQKLPTQIQYKVEFYSRDTEGRTTTSYFLQKCWDLDDAVRKVKLAFPDVNIVNLTSNPYATYAQMGEPDTLAGQAVFCTIYPVSPTEP